MTTDQQTTACGAEQQYSTEMASPNKRPRLAPSSDAAAGLAIMLIDVEEESNGTLLLWGLAAEGTNGARRHQTVLLRCPDYQSYFFIPCPQVVNSGSGEMQEPQQQDLQRLRRIINSRLPDEQHLQSLQVLQLSPIMYYRPAQPEGLPYIQACLRPGTSAKRTAAAVEKILSAGISGFSWRQRGTEPFEADVKLIMRFLSDTSLSGGSWLWACPTPSNQLTHTPRSSTSSTTGTTSAQTRLTLAPSHDLDSAQPASRPGWGDSSGPGGVLFEFVPHGNSSRRSSCDIEVVCSWRCIHSLTPDATQLAQHDWKPQALSQLRPLSPQLQSAAAAAAAGDILPLKLVVLDVLLAPLDGTDRSCNPQTDHVVAIACHITHTTSSSQGQSQQGGGASSRTDLAPAGDSDAVLGAAAGSSSGGSGGGCSSSNKVVFVLSSPAAGAALPPEVYAEGVCLKLCPTERDLLVSWKEWMQQQDPDGLVVFQVRDNLGVLAARFAALQIDGGSAFLSRAAGRFSKALTTKSVVQYRC